MIFNEDLYALLESIYQQTGDLHFRLPLFAWMEHDDAITVIQEIVTLPEVESKEFLGRVASYPAPLTRADILSQFVQMKEAKKSVIKCVESCALNERFFTDEDFIQAVNEMQAQPLRQMLFFFAHTVISIRPAIRRRLCESLEKVLATHDWSEWDERLWKLFMMFLQKAKTDSAGLLYQLPAERVGSLKIGG